MDAEAVVKAEAETEADAEAEEEAEAEEGNWQKFYTQILGEYMRYLVLSLEGLTCEEDT